MSCENFVISPDGRKGIGVVQPQSGLDFPFINFAQLTEEQQIAKRLTWPVSAIIVGGKFSLRLYPPAPDPESPPPPPFLISDLSPVWPSEEPIETALPVVNSASSGTSISGGYPDNITAAIEHYAALFPFHGVELASATIELAVVDDKNLIVGWGKNNSYEATAAIGSLPPTHSATSFFTRWQNYRNRDCGENCATNDVVNPSWALVTDNDIQYLLADFYLEYDDPGAYDPTVSPVAHPLRIKNMFGFGCVNNAMPEGFFIPAHEADILIVDDNDVVVFDSTAATYFTRRAWSQDYEIAEWHTADAVCRVVVYTSWATSFKPKTFCRAVEPDAAVLDERTIQRLPRRVRSIKVRQGNVILGAPIANGSGRFEAGYNMTLNVATTTVTALRRNTDIEFLAEERNEYFDCNDTATEPILNINGVAPKNGDLTLAGAECIYARRPTTLGNGNVAPQKYLGANGYYKVGSDCPACCDCSDYVNTATYMNRIRNRYKTIGARTHETKLLHEENIQRWIESRDCRLEKPLKIVMTPQCCPLMDVLVMFCNQCQSCAEDVTLNIGFSSFPSGAIAEPLCGYTILYAPGVSGEKVTLIGAWPNYSVALPPVDVSNSAYVKFRLKFAGATYPYAITGTLTGTKSGESIRAGCDITRPIASALAVKTLNCDLDGNNIEAC